MTKNPEEIKKGLECCGPSIFRACSKCPYSCEMETPGGEKAYFCSENLIRDTKWLVQQLEAQLPRWISVKEKLPEEEEPVLILVKETEHYGLKLEFKKVYWCQYLAIWDGEEWYTTWCNGCRKISDTAKEPYADDYAVTHWMPLPEPPKENGGKENDCK